MKYFLFIFILLSKYAFTQNDTLVIRKKISVGYTGSFGIGYRHLTQNKTSSDKMIPEVIRLRNGNETINTFSSNGINFTYYFKNKLTFGFDLNYNTFNYKTKIQYYSSAVYDPNIPDKGLNYYQYGTIEIPLNLGYYYQLKNKKIELFANIGIGTHYLLKANTVYKNWYPNGDVKTISRDKTYSSSFNHHLNNFFVSINSKIGIAYNPNKLLSIRLSPEFKYGLTPITNDIIEVHVWGLGINVSVNFKL